VPLCQEIKIFGANKSGAANIPNVITKLQILLLLLVVVVVLLVVAVVVVVILPGESDPQKRVPL
jgi:flagellar basal body-associated protein FliL